MVLDAEIVTDAPGFDGKVRLRADVIQQLTGDRFLALDLPLRRHRPEEVGARQMLLEGRLGDRPRLRLDSLFGAGCDVPLEDEEHRQAGKEKHAAGVDGEAKDEARRPLGSRHEGRRRRFHRSSSLYRAIRRDP